MNRINAQTAALRARHSFANLRTRAAVAVTPLMLAAGTALAGGDPAPDTSAIEAKFLVYSAAAVGLVIAFCVVLWSKRGANLLKP